jgi:Ras-related protein Rab-6A
LIPSYVRDADMCLIVLDLSARSSFENLDKWMDFVRDTRGIDEALIFIVGNKSDLEER